MREAYEDLISRVYVALGRTEEQGKEKAEGMSDAEIEEVGDALQELFQDLAYENDFVRREDCVEIASEMMTEREVDY